MRQVHTHNHAESLPFFFSFFFFAGSQSNFFTMFYCIYYTTRTKLAKTADCEILRILGIFFNVYIVYERNKVAICTLTKVDGRLLLLLLRITSGDKV